MKRLGFTGIIITLLCLVLTASPVSAHELKVDDNIAAVLHINPDDSPVSGAPTKYVLNFDDSTNQLSLSTCDCRVEVQENGQTIYSHTLAVTNSLQSDNTFTFPKPDVYTLQVSGQPQQPGAFQSFTLSYLVRVAGASTHQPFPPLLGVGIGLMMGLVLLGAYASEHNAEK